MGKNLPAKAREANSIPGWGRSPGQEMATHSRILAWKIPWTEESGGLQSMGSQSLTRLNTPAHTQTQTRKDRKTEEGFLSEF